MGEVAGGEGQSGEAVTYIYALAHPLTGAVYCVGKSDSPTVRLKQHGRSPQKASAKRQWIAGLRRQGLTPTIIILESVTGEAWRERERFWIAFHRANGSPLLNIMPGGAGASAGSQSRWRERDPEGYALARRNAARFHKCRKLSALNLPPYEV